MRQIVRRYQNAVAGEVARFDGYVAKFMGDGVLAYFGWPKAHEDEAERAVRAAMAAVAAVGELRTGDGEALAARAGIATGLVVVGGLIGQGAAQEAAVIGATPNIAARLQDLAQPGQVIIADSTQKFVQSSFDLVSLGRQPLKGLEHPVAIFAVERERSSDSRFEARTGRHLRPMVGRDQELALLGERWAQVRSGEGQCVLLVGEAGIGKSRITRALRDMVGASDSAILLFQCSPYHLDSALWPVIQQMTVALKISAEDPPADAARQDRIFSWPPCHPYRERGAARREPARRSLRRSLRSAPSLAPGAAKPDALDAGRAVSRSGEAALRAGGDGGHALDRSVDPRIHPPRARQDRRPAHPAPADEPPGRPARAGGPSARDAARAQPPGARRRRGDDGRHRRQRHAARGGPARDPEQNRRRAAVRRGVDTGARGAGRADSGRPDGFGEGSQRAGDPARFADVAPRSPAGGQERRAGCRLHRPELRLPHARRSRRHGRARAEFRPRPAGRSGARLSPRPLAQSRLYVQACAGARRRGQQSAAQRVSPGQCQHRRGVRGLRDPAAAGTDCLACRTCRPGPQGRRLPVAGGLPRHRALRQPGGDPPPRTCPAPDRRLAGGSSSKPPSSFAHWPWSASRASPCMAMRRGRSKRPTGEPSSWPNGPATRRSSSRGCAACGTASTTAPISRMPARSPNGSVRWRSITRKRKPRGWPIARWAPPVSASAGSRKPSPPSRRASRPAQACRPTPVCASTANHP